MNTFSEKGMALSNTRKKSNLLKMLILKTYVTFKRNWKRNLISWGILMSQKVELFSRFNDIRSKRTH